MTCEDTDNLVDELPLLREWPFIEGDYNEWHGGDGDGCRSFGSGLSLRGRSGRSALARPVLPLLREWPFIEGVIDFSAGLPDPGLPLLREWPFIEGSPESSDRKRSPVVAAPSGVAFHSNHSKPRSWTSRRDTLPQQNTIEYLSANREYTIKGKMAPLIRGAICVSITPLYGRIAK